MEENNRKIEESEVALRFNSGKPKWGLVDFNAFLPMVEVLEYGAKKYAPNQWKKPGLDKMETLESLFRHWECLQRDVQKDEESSLYHIGHLMCNAMFYSHHFVMKSKI